MSFDILIVLHRFLGQEVPNGTSKDKTTRILRDFNIESRDALLIGDTDHDAEVAEALRLSAALVTRGHQSDERLRTTNHAVYGSLQELTQTLFPED